MEPASGRLLELGSPWGGAGELQNRLQNSPLPVSLWLAASGPEVLMQRRLKPMEQQVEEAGLVCEVIGSAPLFTRVLHCQLP